MRSATRLCAVSLVLMFLVSAGLFVLTNEGLADPCPSGSYQRSCNMSSATCTPSSITASCKRMNGDWRQSSLNLPCRQEISNCDGTLRCLCGSDCPAGSYNQSCWCCYIQGSTLGCFCKNKKGKSVPTTLSGYTSCRSNTIWNDNGKLKCQR